MNKKVISDITEFIFVNHVPEKVDIILIPSSSKYETAEKAAELFNLGIAPYVLSAGNFTSKMSEFPNHMVNKKYEGNYSSEWEFHTHVLTQNNVPINNILCEKHSTNTYENAMNSRKVTDAHGLTIKKAIVCCQAFHARRVLMTYSLAYPEAEILICPVNTQGINKDNWLKSEYGITRVMGEVRKCGLYFDNYLKELLLN